MSRSSTRLTMLRASGRSAAEGVAAIITNTNWGGLRVALLLFAHALNQARARPTPNFKETQAMTDTTVSTTDRIRALNDDFRRTFVGGLVVITAKRAAVRLPEQLDPSIRATAERNPSP